MKISTPQFRKAHREIAISRHEKINLKKKKIKMNKKSTETYPGSREPLEPVYQKRSRNLDSMLPQIPDSPAGATTVARVINNI